MNLIAVLIFILFSSLVFATEDFSLSAPSSVSFDFSGDSNQSLNNNVQLDLALPSGHRFLSGLSSSRSRYEEDTYRPRGLMLGVGTNPIDIWSFTLQYNYWGIPREIFSNAVSLTTVYMGLGSQFSITPRLRNIHGEIRGVARTTEFDVGNFGLLFDYVLDISKKWSWSLFGEGNKYSDELIGLQTNIDRIMIVAPNVGEMTTSFTKNSLGTSFDYHMPKLTLGLEARSTTSAISNSRYGTLSLTAYNKISQRFGIGGSVGVTRQVEAQVDPTRFLSISISYFWP